jgi:dipeptidyl aminopeptidase/acylaminoacyl peptidase
MDSSGLKDTSGENILLYFQQNNVETCNENLSSLNRLIDENQTALSDIDKSRLDGARKFLHLNDLTEKIEGLEQSIRIDRMVDIQADSILSADGKFQMPFYYTVPKWRTEMSKPYFIIEVHGGPHAREFNTISMHQQFWTSRGYPYFRFNPRGSTGLGMRLNKAIDNHWMDVVDDIRVLIEWAQAKGFGAPIIKGESFGAYAAIAAYEQGIVDTVIAINGLYDLNQHFRSVSNYIGDTVNSNRKKKQSIHKIENIKIQAGYTSTIRQMNSVTHYIKMKLPERKKQKISLRTYPGKVLLFAGMKDDNCLPEGSIYLYRLLKRRGDAVELITMANEGHSTQNINSQKMILRVSETFLGEITGNAYEPNGYATIFNTPGFRHSKNDMMKKHRSTHF